MEYNDRMEDSVIIENVNDIINVLKKLDPSESKDSDVIISTSMKIGSIKRHDTNIVAKTRDKSLRSQIIEQLSMIKERQEKSIEIENDDYHVVINGKETSPVSPISKDITLPIDPVIKKMFGADRKGIYMYWDINGMIYRYDIFKHDLSAKKKYEN